ncbi:MAG: thiamine diphosphokinase [Actinomycetota bacterium]
MTESGATATGPPDAGSRVVLVFAGGDAPPALSLPKEPAFVIAADSGLVHADRMGVNVDLLVGDLDSIPSELVSARPGLAIERHPPDKDSSDLELALLAASLKEPDIVLVIGGGGGRLDHLLVNAAVLASPRFARYAITWLVGATEAHVIRGRREIVGRPGDLLTLLPYGGRATGVNAYGVRWPLDGETLPAGSSRGLSNTFTADVAVIEVAAGVLLGLHHPQPR